MIVPMLVGNRDMVDLYGQRWGYGCLVGHLVWMVVGVGYWRMGVVGIWQWGCRERGCYWGCGGWGCVMRSARRVLGVVVAVVAGLVVVVVVI